MTIAVYPGSFDPVTNGHLDILNQSSKIFDKVIIAVANNINKKSFLSLKERITLIEKVTESFSNVEVDYFEGLTINYAVEKGANVLIRGLRSVSDFEYEYQMAVTNSALNADIKTVFFAANPTLSFISSSMVKEIYLNDGDISDFVPKDVNDYLKSKRDI